MNNEILKHLPGNFPWQVHWYNSLPSTNDLVKELGKDGAPHGTVVIADSQTKGRGRLGRSFHSPAGAGIYLSVLLRPQCHAQQLMHLTCATAVAMCDAVEKACGFRPGAKWINDLVAQNKKLGGILTEMSLNADGTVAWCVIGIGINCKKTAFPAELEDIAISLASVTEEPVDRAGLMAEMILALKEMSDGLPDNQEAIMQRYRQDCITLGKEVLVIRDDRQLPARALDVDAQGGLTVAYPDGRQETIAAGEVSIRGMWGYV